MSTDHNFEEGGGLKQNQSDVLLFTNLTFTAWPNQLTVTDKLTAKYFIL